MRERMGHDELIEKIRGGERFGAEEIMLLVATMGQGQAPLDMNSFLMGLLMGKSGVGRGLDGAALAMLATMGANSNAQQVSAGGLPVAPNPMNPMLLFALLGLGRGESREPLEIIEKKAG